MLLDVAISEDRNMIKKETEKILRYKDITIEIQRMSNVKKTKVILLLLLLLLLLIIIIIIIIIIKATGAISKSSRDYPNNIPEKHEIKELQQTSPQGTAHMLWKVLI